VFTTGLSATIMDIKTIDTLCSDKTMKGVAFLFPYPFHIYYTCDASILFSEFYCVFFGYISKEEKPHQVITHLKSSPSHGCPRHRFKNAPPKNLKQEVINGTCIFFCLQNHLFQTIMHQPNIITHSVFLF